MTIEQFKNNWQPPIDSCERACFNLDLKELVQQTRAEAIDEFANELCSGRHLLLSDGYNRGIIKATAMNLKEQNIK